MKITIIDELDERPWTHESHPYAVKGKECIRLESGSAHERLAWIAKGYEIRMMNMWEASYWGKPHQRIGERVLL
jgi:hypothetical protein